MHVLTADGRSDGLKIGAPLGIGVGIYVKETRHIKNHMYLFNFIRSCSEVGSQVRLKSYRLLRK